MRRLEDISERSEAGVTRGESARRARMLEAVRTKERRLEEMERGSRGDRDGGGSTPLCQANVEVHNRFCSISFTLVAGLCSRNLVQGIFWNLILALALESDVLSNRFEGGSRRRAARGSCSSRTSRRGWSESRTWAPSGGAAQRPPRGTVSADTGRICS